MFTFSVVCSAGLSGPCRMIWRRTGILRARLFCCDRRPALFASSWYSAHPLTIDERRSVRVALRALRVRGGAVRCVRRGLAWCSCVVPVTFHVEGEQEQRRRRCVAVMSVRAQ